MSWPHYIMMAIVVFDIAKTIVSDDTDRFTDHSILEGVLTRWALVLLTLSWGGWWRL